MGENGVPIMMQRRSARPSDRTFVMQAVAAAALLWALLGGSRAAAQGTFGMLPDPIGTVELMKYADRLNLSAQQRSAFQSMHDQYKQEFRTLRDGEIADFLKQTRAVSGSGR